MQKEYIIVKMKNSGIEFRENWNKIQHLKENKSDALESTDYKNFYYYDASEIAGGNGALVAYIERNIGNVKNIVLGNMPKNYGICLWIEDIGENNLIEYQYLGLMIQNSQDIIAYIYTQDKERVHKVYRNISCYFSFFVQREGRRERIWIQRREKNQWYISNIENRAWIHTYKIMPLLEFKEEINRDIEKNFESCTNLEMWTRTVGELLDECLDLEKLKELESFKEIEMHLKNAKDKKAGDEIRKWTKRSREIEDLCKNSFSNQLLFRCINYFTASATSRSISLIEEWRRIFWSREMQEIVGGMPILSFYMLCIQFYFLKDKKENLKEEIKLLLVNVESITEGVVQLLENIHHSSGKRGLLSIRVHEKGGNNSYLQKKYEETYEKNSVDYFYEFRVLDYSKEGILDNFRKKQNKNGNLFEDGFGIRNFFEYMEGDEFWKKYNRIPENLVHHYGLQIFSTIVSNNNGYFRVISSGKDIPDLQTELYTNQKTEIMEKAIHIPGTEYIVVIPMLKDAKPINPSVETNMHYLFDLQKNYKVERLNIEEDSVQIGKKKDEGVKGQDLKEWRISILKEKLLQQLEGTKLKDEYELVGLLSAEEWEWKNVEIYCKALIFCLIEWKPVNRQGFYVIIKECTPNHFIAITRMFAIFYGKGELSSYMKNVQIYLSGKDPSEEFLIAGKDLLGLLTIARKLTLVRAIQPQCLHSIEYILDKFKTERMKTYREDTEMKLIPFDMLEIPMMQETLFEQAVKYVLENDIQEYSFGCKINHTHMRIGSKLHISEFYEAELLFHNNYYVSRFALLLIRDLVNVIKLQKPIMLVGYENYSELLLYEIVKKLNEKGYESSYMIYEGKSTGRFRYYKSLEKIMNREQMMFITIVPINSTMTTHSKLRNALNQEIKKMVPDYNVKILANYGLILVRTEFNEEDVNEEKKNMENHYYQMIDSKMVKAMYLPQEECTIRYFVAVKTKWHNPLECKMCFPQKNMLDEQPLIETNKASIIPVQMLGIQEPDILQESKDIDREKQDEIRYGKKNEERVEKLINSLIYRHIVRRDNHFAYYFELEKYFMQNREQIIEWLKEIKSQQRKVQGIVYDVIVAPLHYSNAGFVTEVNYYLYDNAALVLNFEIEKEYRENVKTKYSNIVGLYKKLLDIGKEAELRFHFVDDNIITATTYLRAKSLFSSLFPVIQNGVVKVRVFEDVIVMLNRMSDSSIRNYVKDSEKYNSFVYLNISAMRKHEDACIQCKVVENAQNLRKQASTNQMYEFWDKKIYRHRMIEAEKYQSALEEEREESVLELADYNKEQKERQERAGRRMLCNHMFNNRMDKIGYEKNDTAKVKEVMLDLLKYKMNEEQEAMEWLISGIKVFSRPFISFRKSSREAIFQIMLELIEFMTCSLIWSKAKLQKSKFTKFGGIKDLCSVIRRAKMEWDQEEKIYVLLLTLMQRLSDLSSNYVMRKENIKKIFYLVNTLNISEEMRGEFKQRYLSIIKRVTCLSSDENKCIYLEYLLLFQEEYLDDIREGECIRKELSENFALVDYEEETNWSLKDITKEDFQRILFLENTRVLYDGIRDLADEIKEGQKEENLLELIEGKYYYDNFERLLKYYHFITIDEDGTKRFVEENIVITLIKFYKMLMMGSVSEQEDDVEEFYNNFLEYAKIITGARNANLIFTDSPKEGAAKIYKKRNGKEIEIEEADFKADTFVYDTYSIYRNEEVKVLIKYRNYIGKGYSAKAKNPMNVIYLELNFPKTIAEVRLMIALKCIMVFRNLIVEKLERDFSNNLMQKWSAEQIFKKHMKLERATDHTAKDELAEDFKMLLGDMEGCDVKYQRVLFNLIIDSYIARMNVQLLADALPEGENEDYSFEYLYKTQLYYLIKRLHITEGEKEFEIIDENGELEFSQQVRNARIRMYEDARRYERISLRRLSIVIIELIRSAIKYSDNRKVYIYRENQYLIVKNSFRSGKSIEQIRQDTKDAYSRRRDGISLAVIKELIDNFYNLEGEDSVLIFPKEEDEFTSGRKVRRKYYYVKLPILEDGEGMR